MSHAINRRSFLLGSAPAAIGVALLAEIEQTTSAFAQRPPVASAASAAAPHPVTDATVYIASDAPPVSQKDYLATLTAAVEKHPADVDSYLKGGAVTELEHLFARMTGKEDSCFLPTGTLANNLALRLLCGDHKHAIVQADSHLYADESDAPSIMSGITMQPIAAGKAAPTYDEFAAAIADAEHRAYPLKVGALSIESPVRRHDGETVPFETVEKVCAMAKSKGIGTHWDGARAFMSLGRPGYDIAKYAAPFDTVFASLYKALHAPFGAMLSGPAPLIAQARDLRHIFGGLIYHGWVAALPALQALDGLPERWSKARAAAEQVFSRLQTGGYSVERVPNESNIVFLRPSAAKLEGLGERLAKADIRGRVTKDGLVPFFINETLLRKSPEAIAAAFLG